MGEPADAARVINHCRSCGSTTHGQPVLAPIPGSVTPHVSISYAEGLTVVAVTEAGPVGVDVERYDAAAFLGFEAVAAHEKETLHNTRTRTINWVRKESLLKATGRGLTVDPRRILLTEPHEPPALVEWTASDPPLGSVWMMDVEITSSHVAAVTVLCHDPPSLVVKREDPAARPQQASL
jgi:4'-phosphopantetheinyl transferase